MINLYNPQLSAELSLSRDKTGDVFSINILSLSQGQAGEGKFESEMLFFVKDPECGFTKTRLKQLTSVQASVRMLVTWWHISLQRSTDLGRIQPSQA